VPQGNGIRRSKDLRARFRKFLILTNERKKMSQMTMRKRIALTVVTALTTGVLSVVATAPVANAHGGVVSLDVSNAAPTGTVNGSMFVAEKLSASGAAVVGNGTVTSVQNTARSLGLLAKDTSSGTAQTATALTSAQITLYAPVSATVVAFSASAGSFSVSSGQATTGGTATFNQTRSVVLISSISAATTVSTVWVAPSSAGTYTVSLYYHGNGAVPTTSTPAGTLAGQLTVTVTAASTASVYNAGNSFCQISNAATGAITTTSNTDSTAATVNGGSMWINFALRDGYGNALDSGNIVATATNGALIAYGNGVTTPAAGTASTVVAYDSGSGDTIRVNQGTADAPASTTVTISYNGTTICTKTVGFAGGAAKVAVTVAETQNLSTSAGLADFLADGYGRAGLFTVLVTDAAGNQLSTGVDALIGRSSALGTFSVNAASIAGQTIVSALSVDSSATQTSTTLPGRVSTGTYTCGATAGEVKTAKLDFTITATGKTITSDAFTIRCAGAPSSYTATFDKTSYTQGELATLTVKFLDSKGNAANSVSGTGGWTSVTPMLTNVSTTGAAAGLGTTGTKTYTYTVGTTTGMTAGTYTSIIDFTSLTGAGTAVKATPTYKLSAGGDTTSNADILKSIVALIASINKQIQALQKLILKR